ncbi:hypothetical protein LTR22_027793 [Elasticomyces elasticus]|nr:hypothetical protein LTR22_027793 [Elasticomyces elasticus]
MPTIRAVEQPPAGAYRDERRDSVLQMPSVRLEKQRLDTDHAGKCHDPVFQKLLNEHYDVHSPKRSTGVEKRITLSIDDLLLAPSAAPLIYTTSTIPKPRTPASSTQDSLERHAARKHALRTTTNTRRLYQTIFPRPKLPAMPPSTETLAPGPHLYEDSRRWPNLSAVDRQLIKRLAVNDIDDVCPAPVMHAPSLLALLQAVAAMTKQSKRARRQCKGR